jgi:hypothetical protein
MESQLEFIDVGCQVELILRDREGKPERLTIVIVTPEAADFSQGYLGVNTPLAQSLLGEKAGATIPYLRDDIYSIEVISVTRSSAKPPEDAAHKREASIKKATRAVQDTNAILFASSFSGKWGDYDPDSLPKEIEPDDSQE